MRYISSFVFAVMFLGSFAALSSAGEDDIKGFSDPAFLSAKTMLTSLAPEASSYCVNGAAFVLSGQPRYAEQYRQDFGVCMNVLVKRHRQHFGIED